jgi:hypothetical protein
MGDYSRFGDARFEHLAQALTIAALGTGVGVFGDGADGGREATFNGSIDLGDRKWHGYGVIQAKYKARLNGTELDQRWFFSQLTDELDRWLLPRSKRVVKPEYLVIVTNVPLTAVAAKGGLDRLDKLMAEFKTKFPRLVAVGTALSGGPPHRSQRAGLPHWAPALGSGVEAFLGEGMFHAGGW